MKAPWCRSNPNLRPKSKNQLLKRNRNPRRNRSFFGAAVLAVGLDRT
jgi:hypothetical protein